MPWRDFFSRPGSVSEPDQPVPDPAEAERTAALEHSNAGLQRELEHLRRSYESVAAALRYGRIGAWSRAVPTNEMWWSPELEEMLGLGAGELGLASDGLLTYVHEEDHARLLGAFAEASRTGSEYQVEIRFRHASGEWRWLEARGQAVNGPDGRPAMLHGVAIDTTLRRRAEDDLRRRHEELLQTDRRKDEFLAVLAHELRNPLAPIKNSVTVMKARPVEDVQIAWARDVVERQVDQMARLLDDLRDVSRVASRELAIEKERVALDKIVDAATNMSRPLIEAAAHELSVALPPEPVYLEADASRIAQVLAILLENAAQYTERGGHIHLAATVEGRELVLSVRDNGIGIAHEHLPRIFDRFAQTRSSLRRAEGGLGIGLSLAKALVELHSGSILAYSEGPGKGSEFMVRLPLRMRDPLSRASAQPEPTVPAANRRILVADDNHDAAESLSLMLQLSGHDVRTGRDGIEAVSIAAEFHPDVVLLDIGMPRMNGYDAARAIRQQAGGETVVLIALTGWGQDDDKRRAAEAGFDHHLTKPVDAAELERLVATERQPG